MLNESKPDHDEPKYAAINWKFSCTLEFFAVYATIIAVNLESTIIVVDSKLVNSNLVATD